MLVRIANREDPDQLLFLGLPCLSRLLWRELRTFTRPPDKSAYWKTIFFISHPKICCGYSNEPYLSFTQPYNGRPYVSRKSVNHY